MKAEWMKPFVNLFFVQKTRMSAWLRRKSIFLRIEELFLLIIPLFIFLSLSNHIPSACLYLLAAGFMMTVLISRRRPAPLQKFWEVFLTRYLPLMILIIFVVAIWNIYHIGPMSRSPDSNDYIRISKLSLANIDFWLFEFKPFVTPLIFKTLQRNWEALNIFYIILYLFSALLFILMITKFFPRAQEKILAYYIFLMFFLNQQFMSPWLMCALSEIPNMAITLVLLATCGFSFLYQKQRNPRRNITPLLVAANVLVVFFFSFSRDTNLYFLPILLLFYFLIFKNFKQRAVITFFILAIFFLNMFSLQHSGRWKLPLANVIMRGIIPNEGLRRLFQKKYHLPQDDLIMPCAGKFAYEDIPNKRYIVDLLHLKSIAGDPQPQDWLSRYGMPAYVNYLITHPRDVIQSWIGDWDIYNCNLWEMYAGSIIKVKNKKLNPLLFSFPGNVSFFMAILIFLFGMLYLKENPLVLLSLLHAAVIGIISLVGDATEWGRHYQQASMTLKISFLLFILHAYSKIRHSESMDA
jgi:hypothetical protein